MLLDRISRSQAHKKLLQQVVLELPVIAFLWGCCRTPAETGPAVAALEAQRVRALRHTARVRSVLADREAYQQVPDFRSVRLVLCSLQQSPLSGSLSRCAPDISHLWVFTWAISQIKPVFSKSLTISTRAWHVPFFYLCILLFIPYFLSSCLPEWLPW